MSIVDLVFPKMCVGCRREGSYICDICQKKMVKPEAICPMCCKPSIDGWTHPRCRRWDGMERLVVGLPYKGLVQDCLKKVKYKSSWDIIGFLFGLCEVPDILDCVVVGVPMWREKEQKRGFNQAEIVAKLVAGKNKAVNPVLLQRVRETRPMFGLNKVERKENVGGAFKIVHKLMNAETHESIAILVDDVWTTGATMKECAKMLKAYGIEEVWGFALAR